jgi:excisionase family DNA binding protein
MPYDQPRKNGASRGTHVVPVQSAVDPIAIPFVERLTCTIAEACAATGLGRTKLYELIGAGCLATTTVGRRRLVLVRSLRILLEASNSQAKGA